MFNRAIARVLAAVLLIAVPFSALAEADAAPLRLRVAEADATPAPENVSPWRAQVGARLTLLLTGSKAGSVWGDEVYSDDSNLGAAAVHAGVLKSGETGVVKIEILGPQQSFAAASRNGISSGSYGRWDGSFRFLVAEAARTDPGTLSAYSGRTGEVFAFAVTGAASGSVWGDGIYTADSVLSRAAVHAGLLAPGQSGTVEVEMLGAQPGFSASHANGVNTGSWGAYGSSFRFVTAKAETRPDPGTLTAFAKDTGSRLTFEVTGANSGSIWGDGIYTSDSVLARAAVHAGLLKPGQAGAVTVEILGPQTGFAGSQRNGVSSGSWGAYDSSFRFVD